VGIVMLVGLLACLLACLLLGVWKEIDGGKKNVVDSAEDASMMGLFVGWDAARLTATMLVAKR